MTAAAAAKVPSGPETKPVCVWNLPFHKWVGGKRALLPTIEPLLPAGWLEGDGALFEPFLGGGAFFWRYGTGRRSFLQDANTHLVRTWLVLCHQVVPLLGELGTLRTCDRLRGETFYYECRGEDRQVHFERLPAAARAARFLYILATGFNGVYRVNLNGHCNVPWGKRSFAFNEDNLLAAAAELQERNWKITCNTDWVPLLRKARSDDFVFMDPPYVPASTTANFTSYTVSRFPHEATLRLLDDVVTCRAPTMLCNHNVDWLRGEAYARGLWVTPIVARRSVRPSAARTAEELVITNYEPSVLVQASSR